MVRYFPSAAIVATMLAFAGCAGASPPVPPAGAAAASEAVKASSARAFPATAPTHATVYVADTATSQIFEFEGGTTSPKPHVAITNGISQPSSLAIDGYGTLYVMNGNPADGTTFVTEYPHGATAPALTIHLDPQLFPSSMFPYDRIAAGRDGTLFVVDANNDVVVFPRGATTSSTTICNPGCSGPLYGIASIAAAGSQSVYIGGGGGACCGAGIFVAAPMQSWTYVKDSRNLISAIAPDGDHGIFAAGYVNGQNVLADVKHGRSTKIKAPDIIGMSYDRIDGWLYIVSGGTVSILNYNTAAVIPIAGKVYDASAVSVYPATF